MKKQSEYILPPPARVSFDLDEVLFVDPATHKVEPPLPGPLASIYKERLRLGTPDLIRTLRQMGVEVWVYTSSFRSQFYIKSLFRHYKIRFDGIVNGERHLREVQGTHKRTLPQKLPNYYKILLHVDDEDVIVKNGRVYGYQVHQLDADDDEWKEKLLDRVKKEMKKQGYI